MCYKILILPLMMPFFSDESSCHQTGDKHLTRAEAVGADGPFRVVWTDVTLLPLLFWKRWIRQRWTFVLWPEGMEDQTGDAATRASFLGWLLFLFKATAVRAADTRVHSFFRRPSLFVCFFNLWMTEVHLMLILQRLPIFEKERLLVWKSITNSNNKTHLIFLERSHCASRCLLPW